ncbi:MULTISPECIES: DUF7079 family protein [Larsenimonas]|uniref:DUF7079 domain-containing protein n=1 Tax=Larsenimonas suaedae TaxID=1851019 RepID=A0ABU1GT43_9GAMM|nr:MULTISPECIES: hypothetical protein [Larsenimonas]MCM2972057.1 hypothetical protein [Larsenimonas suaedae]MCM5704386.1 hypothetical protein [Larsenimonas salina]MDR5895149.1 hypothetical protein [Larsenimonas suaedae]
MIDRDTLLASRQTLWMSLTRLWLDDEPSPDDYDDMASEILRHDHTDKQLEWIYRLELAPVMVKYQVSITQGWKAFEPERILPPLVRHNQRMTPMKRRWWILMSGMTTALSRPRWATLMQEVQHRRGPR